MVSGCYLKTSLQGRKDWIYIGQTNCRLMPPLDHHDTRRLLWCILAKHCHWNNLNLVGVKGMGSSCSPSVFLLQLLMVGFAIPIQLNGIRNQNRNEKFPDLSYPIGNQKRWFKYSNEGWPSLPFRQCTFKTMQKSSQFRQCARFTNLSSTTPTLHQAHHFDHFTLCSFAPNQPTPTRQRLDTIIVY